MTTHQPRTGAMQDVPVQEEEEGDAGKRSGNTSSTATAAAETVPSPVVLFGASAQVPGLAHRERVFNLAFDASGSRWMASASEASEVKLWDVADAGVAPTLLDTLPHDAEVLRVSWGADPTTLSSSWLATGSAAGGVRIYSVSSAPASEHENVSDRRGPATTTTTTTLVTEFAHPDEGRQVYAMQWVDNDATKEEGGELTRLLLTAADDKVFFWDVETQSVTNQWAFMQLPPAAAEEKESKAYGGANRNPGGVCYVFDAIVGRLYPGQSSDVVCLALSDGSVRVLDRRAGHAVATVRGADGSHLTALCLDTEESVLLACGGRGEVVAYDTRTFSVRAVLEGYRRPVFGAAIVPGELAREHIPSESSGQAPVVMTWSTDTTLRFFELGTDKATARHVVQHPSFPIYTAAFSPGPGEPGRLVLGGGMGMSDIHEHEHGEREGEGNCCDHGHDDHHHHGGRIPPSLLSYQFSK